ncbi:sialin-like isoform X2 [Mytilus galloprovincialis]|uniref:sialin-like isoform X2 n=1 Tax=Mytilus galloprovincialis TaxID=29158 RepID=UPI003F7C680A
MELIEEYDKHETCLKQKDKTLDIPCCCSQRWILAYTSFLGVVLVYAVRVNLSVAIVCMVKNVNSTTELNGTSIDSNTCLGHAEIQTVFNKHAEFDWDKTTRSSILASFFYGYICTQVLGGWFADRYGGRRVFGAAMAVSSVCTILTPVCARTSVILVFVLRVIIGLATGTVFPAMQSMWGRWAPSLERSKLMTFTSVGTMFGVVGTFASSGYLCEYGFDNGWGSIFYITGGFSCIWVVVWFILTRDTPSEHPRISSQERDYIINSIEFDTTKRTSKVPWIEFAKSPALLACITAHMCNNWTNYTLLTSLPDFMKSVMKFNIQSNGLLTALPYLCQAVSGLAAGQITDLIRSRKILSTTATRRSTGAIAFTGAAVFLVATGFMSCNHRDMAVVFLSLAVMFTGLNRAAFIVNHNDFAPKYAGVLFGITNTFATIPGMIAPLVAGALTPHDTSEEWRNVFYVCAAFCLLGTLVFGGLARGEVQDWAKDNSEKLWIETTSNNPPMKK